MSFTMPCSAHRKICRCEKPKRVLSLCFFFQAEDGIRDVAVTGVQTCALPILFFTLLHQRHRRKPTLITSNLGFSEWRSFLKNDHLTAALIDRLTENSYVINMKNCVSIRPKLAEES